FVKKTAKGNSTISQITIRNYIMERFLERLSLSEFKNKFILKG
ncbi:MAG TPA: nucleotidyl transferase AbiEii/AbiGii toxin family protein, partial [Clostridiales bacterium]|nr:nucleotidyl transferase AbiEii/AbiGii toxin family protein [Clostridiales bacterium]